MERLKIYTDGVSRGNPGEAGYGAVLQTPEGEILQEIRGYLGRATNNEAEYHALIAALQEALRYQPQKIEVFSDSELLVNQVRGLYRVRSAHLFPLYQQVQELLSRFPEAHIQHIPREANRLADALANQAVDRKIQTE